MKNKLARSIGLVLLLLHGGLVACSEEPRVAEQVAVEESATGLPATEIEAAAEVAMTNTGANPDGLLVHKSETCGCCALWVDHLIEEGVPAEVRNEEDMEAIKAHLGISERYRSCHTAVSRDGFVFEGHVPALAIRRFMQDPPEGALGLAVPGMPMGSPGMEVDNQFQPYEIKLLMKDGSAKPYGYVSNYEAQFSPRAPEDGHAHQSRAPHNHD